MAHTLTMERERVTAPAWQADEPSEIEARNAREIEDIKAVIAATEALDLPGDDGEPMENERERLQINLTLESLDQYWQDRSDFYAGGNMFVYYSFTQAQTVIKELNDPDGPPRAFRGPDVFVVLDVDGSYRRQKWVTWQEEGRYPDVIFECLSPSTRHHDLTVKKALYEQTFRTHEYFCFDYMNPADTESLRGWRLDAKGFYQPLEVDSRGWLWSERLQVWLGLWSGVYARDKNLWMRLYTPDGKLILTPAEYAQQHAEQEHQRAEQEAQRAEQETQRAESEHQRAERFAAKLRELGIEPEG